MNRLLATLRRWTGSAPHPHADLVDLIVHGLLTVLVFLLPLYVLPVTGSPYDGSKHVLLFWLAGLASLLWYGRMVVRQRYRPLSPISWAVVGIVGVSGLATLFAVNWRVSLFGLPSALSDSLWTVTFLALLVPMLGQVFPNRARRRRLIGVLLLSGAVTTGASYAQMLWQWFGGAADALSIFNLVANSTNVYAMAVATFFLLGYGMLGSVVMPLRRRLLWALLVAQFLLLMVLDSLPAWSMMIAGMFLLLVFSTFQKRTTAPRLRPLATIVILLLAVVALFVRVQPYSPVVVPQDTTLGHRASWEITREALADDPLTGTGPTGFYYAFSTHRPAELNDTPVWSLRFLKPSAQWFQVIATTGALGMIAYLVLTWFVVRRIRGALSHLQEEDDWYLGVVAAWGALTVGGWFYTYSMVTQFLFWLLLALLVGGLVSSRRRPPAVRQSMLRFGAMVSAVVTLVVVVTGILWTTRLYTAELHRARAEQLIEDVGDLAAVQESYLNAVRANPHHPDYALSLAQSLVVDAQLATNADPPETDRIESAITQASAFVNRALELDPENPRLYESKADFYVTIQPFVTDAETIVVTSLEKAIQGSPGYPVPVYLLGNYYLQQAEQSSEDVSRRTDYLNRARTRLHESVELQPQYLVALLRLSIAEQMAGETASAIPYAQQAITVAPRNLDANLLLADLYYLASRSGDAIQQYERVLQLDSDNLDALDRSAELLRSIGELQRARERLVQLQELVPDAPSLQERLTQIDDALNETIGE